MADPLIKLEASRRLSQLLAEGRTWPVQDSLALIQRLALVVQSLHARGKTHRAISAETVSVDDIDEAISI